MYDYKKINQLELDLNELKYKNIAIGSLLAPSFDKLISNRYYTGTYRLIFIKLLLIAKSLFLSFKKRKFDYNKKSTIYFKSGNASHYNYLYECIVNYDSELVTISTNKNLSKNYHDFRKTNLLKKLVVIFWIVREFNCINSKLKLYSIKERLVRISLIYDLILQVFKATYWSSFFNDFVPNQLIGDYDRGEDSSSFFAAAGSIKTTVIQHGVINIGSGGYFPLVADSVFVWGKIAKEQFLELGLNKERIKITGTPIVRKTRVIKTKEVKYNLKCKYNLNENKKLIVLAINPIEKNALEKHLIEFLNSFINLDGCIPLIKLHPAQNKKNILEIFPFIEPKMILSEDLSNDEVFIISDLLVTHNSGIVNESLLYETKVAIFDNLEIPSGNGIMLNKYFGIPLLKTSENLSEFIKKLDANYDNINVSDLFYKIDDDAKNEIIKRL